MTTCYECGKQIKGVAILTVPPIVAESCGDFAKSRHPACFRRAEYRASLELWGDKARAKKDAETALDRALGK